MSAKRIIAFAIIAALLAVIGIQRVQLAGASEPTNFSVIEDGVPVVSKHYVCRHLKLTVLGMHTITQHGDQLTVIELDWRTGHEAIVTSQVGTIPCLHSTPRLTN